MKKLLFLIFVFAIYTNLKAQQVDERLFIFGHSLIDHRPPLVPTPSDETTVPHWLYLLAQESGNTLAAGGKYGFLPQHANDPPFSQWGYDLVPGVWESDTEPFAAANVSTVMITAGNFVQWQGPDQEYPGDPGITPINATETVFDWVRNQSATTRLIIYENWPDMAPFLAGDNLATEAEFTAYNNYLRGEWHDWWLEYHDAVRASRPDFNVKMIPVGPILADILESDWADQIPYDELYEDNAPHGRATLYFLASLITYPALYQEAPPATFDPGTIVHQQIRDNYTPIVNFIMAELDAFNDNEGISRVYCDRTLPVSLASFTATATDNAIELNWSSTSEENLDRFEVERDNEDGSFTNLGTVSATGSGSDYALTDNAPLQGENTYRLQIVDADGQRSYSDLVTASFDGTTSISVVARGNQDFTLSGLPAGSEYLLINLNGAVLSQGSLPQGVANLHLEYALPPAPYFLVVRGGNGSYQTIKVVVW